MLPDYRHWSQIPSNEHGCPGQLTEEQSPDEKYFPSEFEYSLPRQRKGYDTVGYKHYSLDKNTKSDPRFLADVRSLRENDKG